MRKRTIVAEYAIAFSETSPMSCAAALPFRVARLPLDPYATCGPMKM